MIRNPNLVWFDNGKECAIGFDEKRAQYFIKYKGNKLFVSEDGKTLLGCEIQDGDVILPPFIETIGENAFYRKSKLKSIILPDNLKNIGRSAFKQCSNLKSINLPESLETLETDSFRGSGIEEITIPKGVDIIGSGAFNECKDLREVNIQGSRVIKYNAFSNCDKLQRIFISNSIEEIEQIAFRNNINLADVIFEDNSNLKKIGPQAFENCFLREIELPASVEEIGSKAFFRCRFKRFVIPPKVERIQSEVFSGCKRLEDIVFNNKITAIDEGAFKACENLKDISLPESLLLIGPLAFFDCDLRKIQIPRYVKKIGHKTFEGNESLNEVIFPDGFEEIGYEAFDTCALNNGVSLPFSIKKIDGTAFTVTDMLKMSYRDLEFTFRKSECIKELLDFDTQIEFYRNIKSIVTKSLDSNISFSCIVNENKHECDEVMRCLIGNLEVDEFHDKLFLNLDMNAFSENINYLMSLGYSAEEVSEFVLDNNFNLLSANIRNAFDNFQYLLDQKIIPEALLKKLYFGNATGNTAEELFKNYLSQNGCIPNLFNSLVIESNDANKLELRDRLIYVSTMNLLNENQNFNYLSVYTMLNRTLMDSIVLEDRNNVQNINPEIYSLIDTRYPELKGLAFPLYNKMSGIDDNWFIQLFSEMKKRGENTTFNKFYQSLTTIKNWNNYSSEIDRGTLLKNEIIGRLLYADILNSYNSNDSSVKGFAKKRIANPASMKTLLSLATGNTEDIFKNDKHILTMLGIDPYAFDALKVGPYDLLNGNSLEVRFAADAKKNGVLFKSSDIARYNKILSSGECDYLLARGKLKYYTEFINNSIAIAKIPRDSKEEYLKQVESVVKSFVATNSDDDLFNFCQSLDLYLRSNFEFDIQSVDESVVECAKVIFDRESSVSKDAKILYSLYNLNRLAHDTTEINFKSYIDNKYRLSGADRHNSFEKMNKAIAGYNELYKYGLDKDHIKALLKSGARDDLVNGTGNFSATTLAGLNLLKMNDALREIVDDEETQKKIRSSFKNISALSKEEEKVISLHAEEEAIFFQCKKLFADEVMKRLVRELSSDAKSVMHASKQEKIEFYAKNGFIAEIQEDGNGDETLVCLCNTFNEPFAVHLKDLSPDIKKEFDESSKEKTIAHCKLDRRGLTLRENDFVSEINAVSSYGSARFVDDSSVGVLNQVIRYNYDNYDEPARSYKESNNLELEAMFVHPIVTVASGQGVVKK